MIRRVNRVPPQCDHVVLTLNQLTLISKGSFGPCDTSYLLAFFLCWALLVWVDFAHCVHEYTSFATLGFRAQISELFLPQVAHFGC